MTDMAGSEWSLFFKQRSLQGEDLLGRFLEGVARIFEGADEAESFAELRSAVLQLFGCEDLSLFLYDPAVRPGPDEGDWVLTVKAGFGQGDRITQRDTQSPPELVPGRPVPYTQDVAHAAALKAIALAFEQDAFHGCDVERRQVVLLREPTTEDDLGSGDISVLAIPLRCRRRVDGRLEELRMGVLALYRTALRRDLEGAERSLRSLLASALALPACALLEPITRLHTEASLRDELARQHNLFQLTGGKLRGGLVVGTIDGLDRYERVLVAAGAPPEEAGRLVAEALRGVGDCLWERCREHELAGGERYRAGLPGRVGRAGFAVVLPLLKDFEMATWAARLARAVVERPFLLEERLPEGDITVSLRVLPFGVRGAADADEAWTTGLEALGGIQAEQEAAGDDLQRLGRVTATLLVLQDEGFIPPTDLRREPDT